MRMAMPSRLTAVVAFVPRAAQLAALLRHGVLVAKRGCLTDGWCRSARFRKGTTYRVGNRSMYLQSTRGKAKETHDGMNQ
jgi:hypothetical protein